MAATDRQQWDEIDKSDSRVARVEAGRYAHITQTMLGKDMRARASGIARNVIDIHGLKGLSINDVRIEGKGVGLSREGRQKNEHMEGEPIFQTVILASFMDDICSFQRDDGMMRSSCTQENLRSPSVLGVSARPSNPAGGVVTSTFQQQLQQHQQGCNSLDI